MIFSSFSEGPVRKARRNVYFRSTLKYVSWYIINAIYRFGDYICYLKKEGARGTGECEVWVFRERAFFLFFGE